VLPKTARKAHQHLVSNRPKYPNIILPHTRVNKAKKKNRGCYAPVLLLGRYPLEVGVVA
jgi:hypothetical protein